MTEPESPLAENLESNMRMARMGGLGFVTVVVVTGVAGANVIGTANGQAGGVVTTLGHCKARVVRGFGHIIRVHLDDT